MESQPFSWPAAVAVSAIALSMAACVWAGAWGFVRAMRLINEDAADTRRRRADLLDRNANGCRRRDIDRPERL